MDALTATRLADTRTRLAALLADPEPGLLSWSQEVARHRREIEALADAGPQTGVALEWRSTVKAYREGRATVDELIDRGNALAIAVDEIVLL